MSSICAEDYASNPPDFTTGYSVVFIKRTGCNKQTGWYKKYFYYMENEIRVVKKYFY